MALRYELERALAACAELDSRSRSARPVVSVGVMCTATLIVPQRYSKRKNEFVVGVCLMWYMFVHSWMHDECSFILTA